MAPNTDTASNSGSDRVPNRVSRMYGVVWDFEFTTRARPTFPTQRTNFKTQTGKHTHLRIPFWCTVLSVSKSFSSTDRLTATSRLEWVAFVCLERTAARLAGTDWESGESAAVMESDFRACPIRPPKRASDKTWMSGE